MSVKALPVSKQVKAKSYSKSPPHKTEVDKIRALEEQLAQREVEIARLSADNQRLLKETEQRATELQIINNIGQTLTEGLDLNSALERIGERLRAVLQVENFGITAFDVQTGRAISHYIYLNGNRVEPKNFSLSKYRLGMRFASKMGGKPLVVNANAQRYWDKIGSIAPGDETPKSLAMLPMMAGKDLVGSITIVDFEKENAFPNLPLDMLETIASNMGTAIQNVRLFDETQRLLKETEQRATELQVINNIGQTLTDGLDLNNTIERVGERLRETLKFENFGIIAYDAQTELAISLYLIRNGKRVDPKHFLSDKYRLAMRLASRREGKPWVVNTNAEKYWIKFGTVLDEEIAKSFVMFPLLAGSGLVGSITIADYEKENAFTDLPISLLETIASNMGTAIQNVRLFDETQRLLKETEQRAAELQIINNIGQTLTEGFDLQSALERVGERLRDALKIDSIGIAAFDPKGDRVIAQYLYHYGERLTPNQITTDRSKFAIRFAARYGRSWVVNTDAEKHFRKFATVGLPKSFVALPLLAGKEVIGGIILADYVKENAFTDFPIDMLETISSNLGTAIQNARLFDETQHLLIVTEQRATELQIINNIGQMLTEGLDLQSTLERVGERLREVLKIESIGIIANDTRTGLAVSHFVYLKGKRIIPDRFSLGKNLFGMRFAARVGGKPLVVNSNVEKNWRKFVADVPEYAEIPKSFVLVPLLAGRELVGSITIADYEDENAFVDLPLNLLETIASNMGTAIQNVRLFDETQRLLKETEQRATELQIINNIGQTITGELDLNVLIEHVGDKLRETFNVKSIRIVVADTNTGFLISLYMYRNGKRVAFDESWQGKSDRYRSIMRASARGGGRSWVANTNAEKGWRKFALVLDEEDIPKSFVMLPLLAGREVIGGIYIPNYEKENAFTDFSIGMLETIAANVGIAVQNVRLFDETQRLFKEAEEARAAAERANKAKTTFLANMSHELRTPLNAIMGFTSIVRDKSQGVLPEKQINNLEKVLASSQHLLGLINTVLDLAKIEAGRMDVIPAKFNINALIDLCGNLSTPLLKPGVLLEKQVDDSVGIVYSDQDKIKQILLNLLSNAAKFTHAGHILLSAENLGSDTVNISVTDSGIGIKADAIDRVFEEFQQADSTTTRQYGGTGLGLPISRNLARLLGGDLTVTSELGKGSTFTLTIPIQYGRKPSSLPDLKPASVQSADSRSQTGSS